MNYINNLEENLAQAHILLIGDSMLDRFVYGSVSRISSEGPIPVMDVRHKEEMLGGAGNVLANMRGLGAQVDIVTLIGSDSIGHDVLQKLGDLGASIDGVVTDNSRPTTLKTRYIAQNQQILCVGEERRDFIAQTLEKEIIERVQRFLPACTMVVLSDYGRGMLSVGLLKKIIKLAQAQNKPVLVDPRYEDFSVYKGASIITPNKKELALATNNMPVETDEDVEQAGQSLIKSYGFNHVFATRSAQGMSILSKKQPAIHLPTQAQEVYDVSGAGDSVVAMLATALSAGIAMEEAAHLSNIAGGLAVEKVGTAVIRIDDIEAALRPKGIDPTHIAPVLNWDAAKEKRLKWEAQGLKVGFTNGCFDILHYGHVNYLSQARGHCDRLILGLNHDASIRLLKGEGRPINDETSRAAVVAALASVDMVVLFGAEEAGQDNTPCDLIAHLKPDLFMKGGDYKAEDLPETKIVQSYGGQVAMMPLFDGFSTTSMIDKTQKSA